MNRFDRPEPKRPGIRAVVQTLLRPRGLDIICGFLVLVTYAGVQLMLLLGPQPFDPAKYFQTAVDFPEVPVDYWTLRIGLVAPVRLVVLALGPSEAALYAVPVGSGLLLTGAVYWTMVMLFRERILAAAAALVTVLSPPYLLNSSFIFPDTTATATFAFGFFCLVLGSKGWGPTRGWLPAAGVVCAGILFGWSYLIRELSLILLPTVAIALVLLRYSASRIAVLTCAAVSTFALELVYGSVRYGDPFVRVHTLLERRDSEIRPARRQLMERIQEQIDNPLAAILVFPRLLLTWGVGWFFVVLIVVFVAGLVRFRDRRLWLFAAWFFTFWAAMAVFGLWRLPSGDLIVNVTNIRYWYPILPPLAMGAFGSLGLFLREYLRAFRGLSLTSPVVILLAGIVLVTGPIEFRRCAHADLWRNDPAKRWDELRAWFATPDAQRFHAVRTDKLTGRLVPAFTRTIYGDPIWTGKLDRFGRSPKVVPSNPEGTLILVHKDRFASLPDAQERLRLLSVDWSPVFVSDDGRLVLLAHSIQSTQGAPRTQGAWVALARAPGHARSVPGECGLTPYG